MHTDQKERKEHKKKFVKLVFRREEMKNKQENSNNKVMRTSNNIK